MDLELPYEEMGPQLPYEEYARIHTILTDVEKAFHTSTKAFLTAIGEVNEITPFEVWRKSTGKIAILTELYHEKYRENPLFIAMISTEVAYRSFSSEEYEDNTITGVTKAMLK